MHDEVAPNPNSGFVKADPLLPRVYTFLSLIIGSRVTHIAAGIFVLRSSMQGGRASLIGHHIDHSLPGPGSSKKRKVAPGSQRHWDDPEQQSNTLPYDEDDVKIKEDPDNDNVDGEEEEEEEESRELNHDEIWDDSALIAAWESATAEYEAYHGKGKEWKKEPVKKSPLWYNVPPEPAKLKKSAVVPRDSQNTQQDSENSQPLNFDTFVPSHDPSLPQALQPALEPNGLPPVPGEHISHDDAFNRALSAMYWAGYWTAVYHSHQQSNVEGAENHAVTNGVHESLGTAENAEDDDELLVSTQR